MRREGLYAASGKKYRPKQERCALEVKNLLLEQPRPTAINQVWRRLPPKRELVHPVGRFATRDNARVAVFEDIEVYYNRERLHSSLNYETPDTFELSQQPRENQEVCLAA